MPSLALAVKLGAKSAPFVAPFLGDKRSFPKTGSGQPKEIGPKDDCHRHRAEGRARGAADEAAQERAGKSCPLSKLSSACLVLSQSWQIVLVLIDGGLLHVRTCRSMAQRGSSTPSHWYEQHKHPTALPYHEML